jgi:hypothetical protein
VLQNVNLDSLNKWLALLANIGVVFGLVFLALEVRISQKMLEESNALNRINARIDGVSAFTNWRGQWVESEELTRIYIGGYEGKSPSDVSDTEVNEARFLNLCNSELWLHLEIYEKSVALGDIETANANAQLIGSEIGESIGMTKCWNRTKVGMSLFGADKFVSAVDAVVNPQ